MGGWVGAWALLHEDRHVFMPRLRQRQSPRLHPQALLARRPRPVGPPCRRPSPAGLLANCATSGDPMYISAGGCLQASAEAMAPWCAALAEGVVGVAAWVLLCGASLRARLCAAPPGFDLACRPLSIHSLSQMSPRICNVAPPCRRLRRLKGRRDHPRQAGRVRAGALPDPRRRRGTW